MIYKGAIQIIRVAKKKKAPPDTEREYITLPSFILHQLDSMVGPYAGTRPEVIKWIVQTWLHDNREKVTEQVREYATTEPPVGRRSHQARGTSDGMVCFPSYPLGRARLIDPTGTLPN